jgi:hypothetical protein
LVGGSQKNEKNVFERDLDFQWLTLAKYNNYIWATSTNEISNLSQNEKKKKETFFKHVLECA